MGSQYWSLTFSVLPEIRVYEVVVSVIVDAVYRSAFSWTTHHICVDSTRSRVSYNLALLLVHTLSHIVNSDRYLEWVNTVWLEGSDNIVFMCGIQSHYASIWPIDLRFRTPVSQTVSPYRGHARLVHACDPRGPTNVQ